MKWTPDATEKVPRIVLQAVLLAQCRKLSIWHRPEPSGPVISREAIASEVIVARTVMQYLQHLLDSSSQDVTLSFRCSISHQLSAADSQCPIDLRSPQSTGSSVIQLGIKTPQFYRQAVTYEKLATFLSYTLLEPYQENRTAWSNDPRRLIDLLDGLESIEHKIPSQHLPPRLLLGVLWSLYSCLRSSKELKGAYPDPGLPKTRNTVPVVRPAKIPQEENHIFFLDAFVRSHYGPLSQVRYIAAVLGLQLRTRVLGVIGGQ